MPLELSDQLAGSVPNSMALQGMLKKSLREALSIAHETRGVGFRVRSGKRKNLKISSSEAAWPNS